ncbi:MAG: hypothetical protein WC551_08040 [Patescibacteria group bacterium]
MCLPSLLQPGNIPGCSDLHTYTFYASDEAMHQITGSQHYGELVKVVNVQWRNLHRGEWETTSNTLWQMQVSADEGHYMLIMAPDNCVGDGSLRNLCQLCDGHRNPILFGFPRVTEEGWQKLRALMETSFQPATSDAGHEARRVSNRQLVTLAMKHIEQATYPIENRMDRRGIIHGNSWVVRHNVPTPCLLPDEKVLSIFRTNPTLNSGYDHVLPWAMIEKGYPWHLIRHSDIFFLVERGRHLIIEGGGYDQAVWDTIKQVKGLEFFDMQKAVWEGV